jgi:DNA-binding IclR family transcriptional regulator
MKKPIPELRDLAKRRLERLQQPSPAEIAKEIEEARRDGYMLIRVPGVRIKIRDYSLKPPDEE